MFLVVLSYLQLVGVRLERLGDHQRTEIRAPDTDVDDVSDRLASVPEGQTFNVYSNYCEKDSLVKDATVCSRVFIRVAD